jgi:hypothetical protein
MRQYASEATVIGEAEQREVNTKIEEKEKEMKETERKIEEKERKIEEKETQLLAEQLQDNRSSIVLTLKESIARLKLSLERLEKDKEWLRNGVERLSAGMNQLNVHQSVRFAIPLLARVPRLSESTPSTRTGHERASFTEGTLAVLSNVGSARRPILSRIWTRQKQANVEVFDWSSEASIVHLVADFLSDVLYECGLSESVTLTPEMGTFELRPDLWVLRVAGLPVGVVEVKKPGKGVLDHENVLGEVYDYLLHLPNFYGAKQMIGIVTTYREWRVCWLDNEETNILMEANVVLETGPTTPQKVASDGKKNGSPPGLTPSKKRTNYHSISQTEEDEDDAVEVISKPSKREMFASRIWNIENENVFPLVASALLKMSCVNHEGFKHPFDQLEKRSLLRLDETSFYWDRLDAKKVGFGKWDCVPNVATKNLYLLEDLGTGVTGHVWLACSVGGAVCVLKFMCDERESPSVLEEECKWWHTIYPSLAKNVRTAQFCGRNALVMPQFDSPKRDKETLELVHSTLKEYFGAKGLKHPDVKWRNIGVYKDGGSLKAVVFDLVGVKKSESDESEWITDAIADLHRSIE